MNTAREMKSQTGISPQTGSAQLREVHEQWVLGCVVQTVDGVKQLQGVLAQEQSEALSRQRVLAIELRSEGERVKGLLVLPFGLALEQGASLQVDEGEKFTLPYRTSLPIGIVVDLDFDAAQVAELRAGEALKVTAVVADSGQDIAFSIPLNGFRNAHDRLLKLLRQSLNGATQADRPDMPEQHAG